MEGDEMEMTKEELRMWIRDKVKKSRLTSPDMQKKCHQMQSLVERREKLAADLLRLCESVAACEEIVKKQYSLLGWEYKDSDSDEEDDPTGCGCVDFPSETQVHNHPTSPAPLLPNLGDHETDNGKQSYIPLKRELVVVLTRLPPSVVTRALPPSTPQIHSCKDESLSSAESDMPWEPKADPGDSDCSVSSFKTGSNKRRKLSQMNRKCGKTHHISSLNTDSGPQSTGAEASTPTARINISSNSSGAKTSTAQASANADAKNNTRKTLQTNTDSSANSKAVNRPGYTQAVVHALQSFVQSIKPRLTKTPPMQRKATKTTRRVPQVKAKASKTTHRVPQGAAEATKTTHCVSQREAEATKTAHCVPQGEAEATKTTHCVPQGEEEATKTTHCVPQGEEEATKTTHCVPQGEEEATNTTHCVPQGKAEATKTTHHVPQGEIILNMTVIARRKPLSWQQGTILVILTKENGSLKYKVSFKDKGKSLVSGHHIAFDCLPKVEHLYIGIRVVVRCEADQFMPGILAELPCRKNHMRFLVFFDNSVPAYVSLPCLHLVCRPLPDPLDDIPDDNHKSYMRDYIRQWPYPPKAEYKVGQTLKVEFNGLPEKCEVLEVDCSLIQVVFVNDQHKEWLYRGSHRLEHVALMMRLQEKKKAKANGRTRDSSKSLKGP